MNALAQTPEDLAEMWEKNHLVKRFPSDVRHKDLVANLTELKKLGLKVDEVGRSFAGREIFQVEFGRGPTRVFLWSQMHGDEPTATSATIDMLAFFQTHRDLAWVKKIEETLTIRLVPMVNPDGAEVFQRRNLQGIDINRDALNLTTPEARLLKRLRDEWTPAIGFNLHNQKDLTTVGSSGRQAAVSLLVVYGDAAKTTTGGLERNKRIASAMVEALQKFIPGHIGRYDDDYTPSAFGDSFSAWGTPVILVETGALHGNDELFLVKLNFVALITAIDTLASGRELNLLTVPYASLIDNGSGGLYNYVFRGANIVNRGKTVNIYTADLAVNTERRRASFYAPNYIRFVGTLTSATGLENYDAAGFNVVARLDKIKVGELAELLFYKKDRGIDWRATDLEKAFPPDAIFSAGKWVKGKGVVPVLTK